MIVIPCRAHVHEIIDLHRGLVEPEQLRHLAHASRDVAPQVWGRQAPYFIADDAPDDRRVGLERSRQDPIERGVVAVAIGEERGEDHGRPDLEQRLAQPRDEFVAMTEGAVVFPPEDRRLESGRHRDRLRLIEPDRAPDRLGCVVEGGGSAPVRRL